MDSTSCPEPKGSGVGVLKSHLEQCKGQLPSHTYQSIITYWELGTGFQVGFSTCSPEPREKVQQMGQPCPSIPCLCRGQRANALWMAGGFCKS